ncbi:ATP-binding cassette domain-containing protein [Buchananella hordeovulneris]|uniref:ABC transporter n=1 Tax=Buchananella hordeovulneris TaxID=52770 RepID=A0A1Q5PU88_9ACTO|nr:ATP-binding cassette domain-containing protein [Buchananella hordeovulneris]MDO5081363.1 ATP-binding cassette domain-containing protein [Buchananella hordeovulneris]OKL51086.1 ABC transporter [Buchananella hordeovulneris]RRD43308.1 ATP-binding cassette domain-containing protein [Buchananella hordeovulneris]RRD51240.1 ATP-binding cassette domain-containing protein [Buchananella hordeovulneris]
MFEIAAVTKRRGARPVLTDVSFAARRGRVTAFLGANGAGKSSTLRILLGLDRPDAGTATVAGRPYRELACPARTVGAVLGGPGAHRSRTGRSHLAWLAAAADLPARRVDEVLTVVGLREAARRRVGTYSLGMGQRLGLAAALLGEPEGLVLDEPFNGLDPEGIRWLRELLRGHAAAGGAVLLSSHLIGEVAGLADDVVLISSGRIVAAGPVDAVVGPHADLESAYFAHTAAPHPPQVAA